MSLQDVGAALRRVEAVLQRRPEAGMHDDAPAAARWLGGTRVAASHANGTEVNTDMARELGGSGGHVTPGWLFRAGLASCVATSIAFAAASEDILLTALDVSAHSRSDTRGILGMTEADGTPVSAGPGEVTLVVHIAATGVDAPRLRALVELGLARSPIPNAVTHATPYAVHIEVAGA